MFDLIKWLKYTKDRAEQGEDYMSSHPLPKIYVKPSKPYKEVKRSFDLSKPGDRVKVKG